MTEHPKPSALCGVLRSQVAAAIESAADDDRWPDAAVGAVMAVVEPALEAVRQHSPASPVAAAADVITQAGLAEALDSGQFGLNSSFAGGRELAVNIFAWLAARASQDAAEATATEPPSPASPEPPALTTAALLAQLREKVSAAIGPAWGPAAVDQAVEAVSPLIEHAAEAAAGSHEGVRLWMLDCGALVAKHRARAEAAEAKLAALAGHNRQHLELSGSCCPHLAQENLAIIGDEEEIRG